MSGVDGGCPSFPLCPDATTLGFRFPDDSGPEFLFSCVLCEQWRETWRLLAAVPEPGTAPESITCCGVVPSVFFPFPL